MNFGSLTLPVPPFSMVRGTFQLPIETVVDRGGRRVSRFRCSSPLGVPFSVLVEGTLSSAVSTLEVGERLMILGIDHDDGEDEPAWDIYAISIRSCDRAWEATAVDLSRCLVGNADAAFTPISSACG